MNNSTDNVLRRINDLLEQVQDKSEIPALSHEGVLEWTRIGDWECMGALYELLKKLGQREVPSVLSEAEYAQFFTRYCELCFDHTEPGKWAHHKFAASYGLGEYIQELWRRRERGRAEFEFVKRWMRRRHEERNDAFRRDILVPLLVHLFVTEPDLVEAFADWGEERDLSQTYRVAVGRATIFRTGSAGSTSTVSYDATPIPATAPTGLRQPDQTIERDVEDIAQLLQRTQLEPPITIPLKQVRQWMRSEQLKVMGAVSRLIRDATAFSMITPRLSFKDYHRFFLRYYERCIREDPEGEWVHNRYGACWDLESYFCHLWKDRTVPRTALTEIKNWLGTLYLNSDKQIRTAIVTGTIEHLFEKRSIKRFFADWRANPVLAEAYRLASEWVSPPIR